MNPINNEVKKYSFIPFIIMAFCTAVFITLTNNQNVWLDEAFTATLVHTGYREVLSRSMADTLPPLYNLYLKFMTSTFGYKVPVMKITSVIPMVATMLVGAVTVRRRFGNFVSSLFIILITGMPLMFYFGVEIRMYSLGFLFATASGVYAYECIVASSRKNWILFILFSVAAGYSHHFAFVTVGFIYLYLLLYYFFKDRSHIKRWFLCLLATFVLYFPCLLVTLKQFKSVSGYFSMPDVTISLFIQYVLYPFTTGKTVASVILLLLVIFFGMRIVYKAFSKKHSLSGNDYYSILCFLTYYCVLMFGTIISKIMTANIFVDRYLFFSTGILWLAIAIQAGSIPNKLHKALILSCVLFVSVATYNEQFTKEYANSPVEELEYISSHISSEDILYTVEDSEELAYCLPFYEIIANEDEGLINYEVLTDAVYAAKQSSSVLWIAVMDNKDLSDSDIETLKQNGLSPRFVKNFDFDRYKCSLYRVE